MARVQRPYALSRPQLVILSVLISAAVLNNFRGTIKWVGFVAILLALLVGVVLFLELQRIGVKIPRSLRWVATHSFLLSAVYLIAVITDNVSQRSLVVFGQLVGLLLYFFTISLLSWSDGRVRSLSWMLTLPIVILSVLGMFDVSFANSNTLGGFLAFLLFWPTVRLARASHRLGRWFWFVVLSVGLIGLALHGARSTWLAVAGSGMTYIFLTVFRENRIAYNGAFLAAVVVLLTLPFVYSSLAGSSLGFELQSVSRELTGKNFFSGREAFWPSVYEAVWERPILGYGGSATPAIIADVGLSSHNLYLQVALQTGLTGLVVLLALLYSIWKVLWLGRHDEVVRLASAFMIGIMLHQTFEVSLTQNNLAIALVQWLPVGVGVSRCLRFPSWVCVSDGQSRVGPSQSISLLRRTKSSSHTVSGTM